MEAAAARLASATISGGVRRACCTRAPEAADCVFVALITTLSGVPKAMPPAPRHAILGEWYYSMFLE